MELGAGDYRRGGLSLTQVNKVHHVHTIARVAEMLGEDEDWLRDVAIEMDQEDGLIWVYGPGDDSVMAFTDFGIETSPASSRSIRPIPTSSSAQSTQSDNPAAYAACLRPAGWDQARFGGVAILVALPPRPGGPARRRARVFFKLMP